VVFEDPCIFFKKRQDEITKKEKHEITKWTLKTRIQALGVSEKCEKCANLLVVNLEFVL